MLKHATLATLLLSLPCSPGLINLPALTHPTREVGAVTQLLSAGTIESQLLLTGDVESLSIVLDPWLLKVLEMGLSCSEARQFKEEEMIQLLSIFPQGLHKMRAIGYTPASLGVSAAFKLRDGLW
ncbi:hypothetical protein SELMODRAFT_425518 [Selaginella moellendorffii]|uniref:Uncharacterized protein n=1 Tax=Selaginella moellendorffii TaxID=88036 RepID=D8STD0_SELML|nr:hypothetical protein SELMODRAFT_425518 [Selaginella moellendorffii]